MAEGNGDATIGIIRKAVVRHHNIHLDSFGSVEQQQQHYRAEFAIQHTFIFWPRIAPCIHHNPSSATEVESPLEMGNMRSLLFGKNNAPGKSLPPLC